MNKPIRILTFFAALLLGLTGIVSAQTTQPLTIYAIKGPSGVSMIRLFESPPLVGGVPVRLEALAQADLMAAKFISGEAKVGMLPPNVAAKIASTGKPLQIAAVTGTGMLSLLTSDSAIRSIADLGVSRWKLPARAPPRTMFSGAYSFPRGLTPTGTCS
ncbi:hypothetical protein [Treponema primitia]|uniref:hypothetical protein n=1 Tax=Treponema primitia TaxID=88058 RepID=UPI001E2DBD73|nr:hypothetical protein [Treponema primitia]